MDFVVELPHSDESDPSRMTDGMAQEWLDQAVAAYDPGNSILSSVLGYSTSSSELTQKRITEIGTGAQSDLTKILQANSFIHQYINTNDIIGMVVSTIFSNINTEMRHSYAGGGTQKLKAKTLEKVKALIADFDRQINVQSLIRDAILTTYTDGNYICVLRNDGEKWVSTQYPLGIAEISPYLESSRPIVQINMANLGTALQRTILKNKKGKALYFADVLSEIKGAFGEEIKQTYQNKDQVCRMPTEFTGVCRINTQGGVYGLSPIFRCLSSAIILETLRQADMSLANMKRKGIIHQVLRKEGMLGTSQAIRFELVAWSHDNLMSAFKNSTVLVTTDPAVERIEYVSPKVDEVSTDKQSAYARQILSSLGVSFLVTDDGQSAATAKISWQILLQHINAIGEQVERMLENFYRTLLQANGIDDAYCPRVKIIDSEMQNREQRAEFARLIYGLLGCSLTTTLETLGIDINDEAARREMENSQGLAEIFAPHLTSYTVSGNGETGAGRPASKNPDNGDKQDYDKDYNNDNR